MRNPAVFAKIIAVAVVFDFAIFVIAREIWRAL